METIYFVPTLSKEWNANYPYLYISRNSTNKTAIIKLTNYLESIENYTTKLVSVASRKISLNGHKECVGLRRVVLIKNQFLDMENMQYVMINERSHKGAATKLVRQLGSCIGVNDR